MTRLNDKMKLALILDSVLAVTSGVCTGLLLSAGSFWWLLLTAPVMVISTYGVVANVYYDKTGC